MDDLSPEIRRSREEMEAHYVGAIGHYAGIIAQLEAKLSEAKQTQSMFKQKLHSLHNPTKKRKSK